jgi:two-component system response regulator PilR (NtrC family)
MLPQRDVDLLLEPEVEAGTEVAEEDTVEAAPNAAASSFDLVDGVPSQLPAYLDQIEAQAIRAALVKTRNNRTAAAQLLGITFRQLRYRMQRLRLK